MVDYPGFGFEVLAEDPGSCARVGRIDTPHGPLRTPAFIFCATKATVKAASVDDLEAANVDIILANTYHMLIQPGPDVVERMGGLHKFMGWDGPMLTDSGGFQIMSLAELRKLDEDGVTFRSHVDGSKHKLTPERSIQIQHMLGSNITMALDECTHFPATEEDAAISMQLSMRWAKRCRHAFRQRNGYGLFGIVQGGIHANLREESAKILTEIGFDGYAVGGLAVGEGRELMFQTLDVTVPYLPTSRPRYLMGVGKPEDLVGAVQRGIDMFDCVLPTRSGRTDQAFTRRGTVNMRNARHRDDPRPIDPECTCYVCQNYSRGYINHLIMAKEILAAMLLTWHNLHYYQELMQSMRDAIATGGFELFAAAFTAEQAAGDVDPV